MSDNEIAKQSQGLPSINVHADHDEATVEDKILAFCSVPRSRDELLEYLKLSDRKNLRTKYLNPLLASGQLKMTIPDKPRSKQQKYVKA